MLTFLFYLPVKPEQTLSDGSITLIPSHVFCATVVTAWIIIHSIWFCAVAEVSSMFSFFSSKQSHFLEQLYECKQINFKPLSSRNSREADFVTDWFDLPLKRKPLTLTLLCSWGIPLMCHIIPTSVIFEIFFHRSQLCERKNWAVEFVIFTEGTNYWSKVRYQPLRGR